MSSKRSADVPGYMRATNASLMRSAKQAKGSTKDQASSKAQPTVPRPVRSAQRTQSASSVSSTRADRVIKATESSRILTKATKSASVLPSARSATRPASRSTTKSTVMKESKKLKTDQDLNRKRLPTIAKAQNLVADKQTESHADGILSEQAPSSPKFEDELSAIALCMSQSTDGQSEPTVAERQSEPMADDGSSAELALPTTEALPAVAESQSQPMVQDEVPSTELARPAESIAQAPPPVAESQSEPVNNEPIPAYLLPLEGEPVGCDETDEAPPAETKCVTVKEPTLRETSKAAPVLKTCAYFWSIVKSTTDLLNGEADKWDQINSELDVTEDVHGDIRTTACQARLIIAERFHQFSGLIKQCEDKTGVKPVLCEDLDGFWDMIYFQVEDVLNKFNKLAERQQKAWVSDSPARVEPQPKVIKKIKKVKPSGPSKFAQFRAQMKKRVEKKETPEKTSVSLPEEAKHKFTAPFDAQAIAAESVHFESPKTYSLRQSTVLSTIKSLTASAERANNKYQRLSTNFMSPSVTLRQSAKKSSARKSAAPRFDLEMASPDLFSKMSHTPLREKVLLAHTVSTDTPGRRTSLMKRHTLSPSPAMIQAMVSASRCGKTTASAATTPLPTCVERGSEGSSLDGSLSEFLPGFKELALNTPVQKKTDSLHKSVLRKSTRTMESPVPFTPDSLENEENEEPDVVNDLVVFTPIKDDHKGFVPMGKGRVSLL